MTYDNHDHIWSSQKLPKWWWWCRWLRQSANLKGEAGWWNTAGTSALPEPLLLHCFIIIIIDIITIIDIIVSIVTVIIMSIIIWKYRKQLVISKIVASVTVNLVTAPRKLEIFRESNIYLWAVGWDGICCDCPAQLCLLVFCICYHKFCCKYFIILKGYLAT